MNAMIDGVNNGKFDSKGYLYFDDNHGNSYKIHAKDALNIAYILFDSVGHSYDELDDIYDEWIYQLKKGKSKPKKKVYKITDEDIDLLIEIENVLCKKSRSIFGITRKKTIKGGGDITPYETGYSKVYDYMELVARIIG